MGRVGMEGVCVGGEMSSGPGLTRREAVGKAGKGRRREARDIPAANGEGREDENHLEEGCRRVGEDVGERGLDWDAGPEGELGELLGGKRRGQTKEGAAAGAEKGAIRGG